MKKTLYTLLALFLFGLCQPSVAIEKAQEVKQTESLKYNAYWHWGFIWKLAGSGTLNQWEETLSNGTKRHHVQLCGRSMSIVESIMQVRDTLDSYYTPELIPLEYSKRTNEGSYKAVETNYYKSYTKGKVHDDVFQLKREDVDSTTVDIHRWRIKKGHDKRKVRNKGVGFDMLSIFYELRHIDFSKLKKGDKLTYYITAGVKNKTLNVIYKGRETCTLKNGKKYSSHAVTLTFSSKDSDSTPLHAWLSTSPDQRPLSVIIDLKRIGSVQGEIVE